MDQSEKQEGEGEERKARTNQREAKMIGDK
jgi:hypothetical protein